MPNVVGVRFHGAGKAYHFDPGSFALRQGDAVIVETVQGIELGIVADEILEIAEKQLVAPLKPVLRIADDEDLAHYEANCKKEAEAYKVATEKITARELDMHLVNVEYTFDNRKIIFYFTADGRVDFRELVKDLAAIFRIRIELRQIGVRDEARMIGGVGICGRELCCCSFLNDFVPVSIKMAKEQSLSMNPAKISGICGRLMCCLKYEQDAYEDAHSRMPRQGHQVSTPDGDGYVESINLLKETVTVRLDRGGENDVQIYSNDDVVIIGGKPGKRCPPGGCPGRHGKNGDQQPSRGGRPPKLAQTGRSADPAADEMNWPRLDDDGNRMTEEEIAEEDLKRLEEPDRCDLAVMDPEQMDEDLDKRSSDETDADIQKRRRSGRSRNRSGSRTRSASGQGQHPHRAEGADGGETRSSKDVGSPNTGRRPTERRSADQNQAPGTSNASGRSTSRRSRGGRRRTGTERPGSQNAGQNNQNADQGSDS